MSEKPIDRWLALGALVVGIIYFWIPKTPSTLIISLAAIFLLLIHPLWNFWWIEKSLSRQIIACLCLVVCLFMFGFVVWPPPTGVIPEKVEQKPLKDKKAEQSIRVEQPKKPNGTVQKHEVKREGIPSAKEIASEINKESQKPMIDFDIRIIDPLAYDNEGRAAPSGWHIGLEYQLTNVGKIPADDVLFQTKLLPFIISVWPKEKIINGIPQGSPEPGTKVAIQLKKFCNDIVDMAVVNEKLKSLKIDSMAGEVVFPGKPVVRRAIYTEGTGEIDAAKTAPGYSGQFVLLACVIYHSNLDNSYHKTGKAFSLFKQKNISGKYAAINLSGEQVPIEDLVIVHHPLGGDFAD